MPRPRNWLAAGSVCLLLVCASPPSHAAGGGAFIELGHGTNGTDATLRRLGLWWEWGWRLDEAVAAVSGYWEFDIGHWEADAGAGDDQVLEFGLASVLRFRRPGAAAVKPFLDLGVGVQWLSDTRFAGKDISTSVQFSPRAGFGLMFGREHRYEVGYRLLHVSNASIATPNPGVDFHVMRLGVRF